jgi:uncharacterized damage-inducible protein DinB
MDAEQFLRRMSASQDRFEQVLVTVKPELRDFAPMAGYRTIGQQLAHLLASRHNIMTGLRSGDFPWSDGEAAMGALAHADLASALRRLYSDIRDTVVAAPPEWFEERPDRYALTREEWLWELLEHENYHLGQLNLSLRLAGGEPAAIFG